jgi:hypothetical protein
MRQDKTHDVVSLDAVQSEVKGTAANSTISVAHEEDATAAYHAGSPMGLAALELELETHEREIYRDSTRM